MNFDVISESRLDLSKIAKRHFTSIIEKEYNFEDFNIINKYSKSILKQDLQKFYRNTFLEKENLKFTIYMYSKKTFPENVNFDVGEEYQEIKN